MESLPQDVLVLLTKDYLGLISSVRLGLTSNLIYSKVVDILKKRKTVAEAWVKKYIVPRVELNRYCGRTVSTEEDLKKVCKFGENHINVRQMGTTLARIADVVDYILLVNKKTGRLKRGTSTLIICHAPPGANFCSHHDGNFTVNSMKRVMLPMEGMIRHWSRVVTKTDVRPFIVGRFLDDTQRERMCTSKMEYQLFADDSSLKIYTQGGIGTFVKV